MVELYTWTTPNGRKVSILLEELGVPYAVHPVDITNDAQFALEFLKISPNNKIPAIHDRDTGLSLMESGAIMLYLAGRHGRFTCEGGEYWRTLEWLMWQMGGLGPMLGQVHHFVKYNPGKAPYAETRFTTEAHRLYRVLDERLTGRDFVAGTGTGAYTASSTCVARLEEGLFRRRVRRQRASRRPPRPYEPVVLFFGGHQRWRWLAS